MGQKKSADFGGGGINFSSVSRKEGIYREPEEKVPRIHWRKKRKENKTV